MEGFDITLTDNSEAIRQAVEEAKERILERWGMTAEGFAKDLCPTDTTALRNSITHETDSDSAYVGSNMHYAPYVEMGTGIYAEGGGRQTPWVYCDNEGNFHQTNGQQPQPFLKPAIADNMDTYRAIFEEELKG